MPTIVYQQSRLESHQLQVLEPRTISLKLSCFVDEKRFHSDDDEKKISSTTAAADDSSSSHYWSFLQAISNNGSKLEATNKETATTYVHPLENRSKSTLSEKSLELCTENLGSETGTDIIIEDDDGGSSCGIFSENGGKKNIPPRREVELQKCAAAKKATARKFPPPLTTIRGVASLQVRPHREDGRLIIKATKAPSPRCSLFQAERSHGRLRLSLYKDPISDEEIDNDALAGSCGDREDEDEDEGEEEEEEEEEEERDVAVAEGDFDVENDGDMGEEEEEEEEGVNGNYKEFGGKMRIKKKFPRRRTGRCKEGEPDKKGLLNWEALCVATS